MKKVLLIGDSISLYYSPYLQDYLKDQIVLYRKEDPKDAFANLDHPTGPNGGDSARVLNYLKDRFKAEAPDFDLFAFNCGLHDIKHIHGGDCVISPEQYKENLEGILAFMAKHQVKTVFITTTELDDERHNSRTAHEFTRHNADVLKYNEIALSVMKAHRIPVIDLRRFTNNLPGEVFIDHVHFVEEVRALQAAFLAGSLQEYLH